MLVTGNMTVPANNDTDVSLKNFALFCTFKAKNNDVFIDGANHICIAMPLYNLSEYSDNYSNTSWILWQFKGDEVPNNKADLTIDNPFWLIQTETRSFGKTANAFNKKNSFVKKTKNGCSIKTFE